MYDKVKLWIDRAVIGGQALNNIPLLLDEAKEQTNIRTGECKTFGCIEGLKVSVYCSGLYVVGSLPKYLYGNNIYPLDRHTTPRAFEKIEDALHIPISEAMVTGLEFGTTFVMKHPVGDYLKRMGDASRLVRCSCEASTLYYKNRGKQQPKNLCFYDKGKEEIIKGCELPKGFENANLLRYELRLNGKLHHQLKWNRVEASTLSTPEFYKMMIDRWQSNYYSISKLNQVRTDIMTEIKTVGDAFEVLVARLINQSNQAQISEFLDELKEAHTFEDRKSYTRLKKKIQDVATKAGVTNADELIKELDDEVKNIGIWQG